MYRGLRCLLIGAAPICVLRIVGKCSALLLNIFFCCFELLWGSVFWALAARHLSEYGQRSVIILVFVFLQTILDWNCYGLISDLWIALLYTDGAVVSLLSVSGLWSWFFSCWLAVLEACLISFNGLMMYVAFFCILLVCFSGVFSNLVIGVSSPGNRRQISGSSKDASVAVRSVGVWFSFACWTR